MILTRNEPKFGRKCVVPPLNHTIHSGPVYVRTLKECTFIVRGPQIFNCIPVYLRNFDGPILLKLGRQQFGLTAGSETGQKFVRALK